MLISADFIIIFGLGADPAEEAYNKSWLRRMRESPRDNKEDSRRQEDSPTSTRASNGTSTMQTQFRARAETCNHFYI